MAHTFTRQELYELVWDSPMTVVAKQLGVSDVWLRKNCVAANIPVPGLGYWARKRAGQNLQRIPLPERGLGEADEIAIGRQPGYWYPQDAEIGDIQPLKPFPESLEEVRQRACKLVGIVKASRSLDKPHPVIARLLKEDEQRRMKLQETPYYWEKPRFESLEDRRRLRILNGLFLGLSRAGASPWCRGKDPLEWGVRVGDTSISINLEIIKSKPSRSPRQSSGDRKRPARFRLSIDHPAEFPDLVSAWEDQDDRTLEQQIGEVAMASMVAGEMHYRAWVIRRYRWLVERHEEYLGKQRLQREKEERRQLEEILRVAAERRTWLIADASAWRQAADVRAFIATVRERQSQCRDGGPDKGFQEWIVWATEEADRIDPLNGFLSRLADWVPASIETGEPAGQQS